MCENIPKINKNIDLSDIMELTEEINEALASGDYSPDSDDPQYLYEAVFTALYGKDYWIWRMEKEN